MAEYLEDAFWGLLAIEENEKVLCVGVGVGVGVGVFSVLGCEGGGVFSRFDEEDDEEKGFRGG